MIYFDYSATTRPHLEVLSIFNEVANNSYYNPNSAYKEAQEAKALIDKAIINISNYFGVQNSEIIFTSGASESNNLAIKGLAKHSNRKHIITTKLEHSSIISPINYLVKEEGYSLDFVELDQNGQVDLTHLAQLINDDTFLVSINAVDSEIGIRQPIEKIGNFLTKYKGVYFHSDITQCVGKDNLDLTNVDLASFSAHKLYCFKGIGGLIKKNHIQIEPLIHGGHSTTVFRSGTPQTELICSMSAAFNLFNNSLDDKIKHVKKLNLYLKSRLKSYHNIVINSTAFSIPHILNLSIVNVASDRIQQFFAEKDILISTKSACASNSLLSQSIMALTNDSKLAQSSVRISLSHVTTYEEIDTFLNYLEILMEELNETN